jgi:hypothetical protein
MTVPSGKTASRPFTGAGSLQIIARPHPFSAERISLTLPAGPCLAEMLEAVGLSSPYALVYVGDRLIPAERWSRAWPRPGATITVRAVPSGGGEGGKDPLRMVAMIVVVAVAAWAGGAVAGMAAFAKGATVGGMTGATWGAMAAAGVGMAGSLLVNALIPPPTPKSYDSGLSMDRGHAITGTRNQLLPYGTIPRPFGRHRMFPPLAALPYTETIGGDQYYRMLFVPGYGPLEISEMRIGETLLSEYEGVETEIVSGAAGDAPLTIFSNDIFEEAVGVPFAQEDGDWVKLLSGGEIGLMIGMQNAVATAWTSRTTQADAEAISIEISSPAGLVYLRRKGRKGTVKIDIEVEVSPAGEGVWTKPVFDTVAGDGSSAGAGEVRIQGDEGATKRVGVSFSVAAGQYDVRLRRAWSSAGLDSDDDWSVDYLIDDVYWSALRSVRNSDPVQMEGLCKIALRIKATDQLNGVLDRFNCVVQALLPAWDGAQWTAAAATSSPAWAFAEVLTGSANHRSLAQSRLDGDALKDWADWCAENGIEYNAVLDGRSTVWQLLRDIASVGFAAPSMADGLYTVVRDLAQPTLAQHFTPRNSWGFSGSKIFADRPHGLKVRYLNPAKGFQQDEVIAYDDGFDSGSAERFESLELYGVTGAEQAWKTGRYHLAVSRLRPETYELWADVESLVVTRGDLVRVSHDVPLWGVGWGRIKTVDLDGADAVGVALDEAVVMEADKTYGLRVRCADGTSVLASVVAAPGETTELVFAGPVSGIAAGDLAMFGEEGTETVELLVKSIEPGPDLTARLVLVDAAPGVHQAWTGVAPAFDSQITLPAERSQIPPPTPRIDAVVSNESVLVRTVTGLQSRIVISYSFSGGGTVLADRMQVQFRPSGQSQAWSSLSEVPASRAGSVAVPDVVDGASYDLRLRSISSHGVASPWVETAHTVIGKGSVPADVTGLSLQLAGGRALLTWSSHPDLDVQVGGAILIRHTRKTSGAAWADGMDIGGQIPGTATSANLPAIAGTYLVRAVDSGGRLSAATAQLATTAPSLLNYNVVETLTESPDFLGVKTDCVVDGAGLKLAETDGLAADSGLYEFDGEIDLGGVFLCRVLGEVTAAGYEIADTIDARGSIDDWDSVDGAAVDDAAAVLEIRTTEDDPAGSPAWTDWRAVQGTEILMRALQARLSLATADPNHNVLVSSLGVVVDMPDRTASARNVAVSAAGLSVVFSPAFLAIPAIGVTLQNMQQGDYFSLSNQGPGGFDITIYNAGAAVARAIDWQAAGYGTAS